MEATYREIGISEPLGKNGDADAFVDHGGRIIWYNSRLRSGRMALVLKKARREVVHYLNHVPIRICSVPLLASTES